MRELDSPSGSKSPLAGWEKWLFLMMVCYALPRVLHPLIPGNLSGIDLIPLIALAAIFLAPTTSGQLRFPPALLLLIAAVPIIMVLGNLVGYLVFQDKDALIKGILQTYRRCAPALLVIFLSQIRMTPQQGERLLRWLFWSLLISAALFLFVETFKPLGFTNRSRLSGNFLAFEESGEQSDSPLFGTVRVAGNAGSQTTYGFLVAAAALLVMDLVRHQRMRLVPGVLFVSGLLVCLLLSSAKMIIAATVLAFGVVVLFDRRLWLLAVAIGLIALVGVGAQFSVISESMLNRSEGSLGGRVYRFSEAQKLLQTEPERLIFGNGWKSGDVGWHSEPLQFVMDFGILPGIVLMFITYLIFPLALWRMGSRYPGLPSSFILLCIFAVGVAGSLFHDVLLDAYTLFAAGLILAVKTQTDGPPVGAGTLDRRDTTSITL